MSDLFISKHSSHLMTKCTPIPRDLLLRYTVAYLQQSNQIITLKLLCEALDAPRSSVWSWVSSAQASGQLRLLRRSSAGRFGFYYVIELND